MRLLLVIALVVGGCRKRKLSKCPDGYEEGNDGYRLVKFVSDTLDDSWSTGYLNKGGYFKTVLVVDTTLLVNNVTYTDVVLIGLYAYSYIENPSLYGLKYYAKDVGLIRSDAVGGDTTTSKSLIDYLIVN